MGGATSSECPICLGSLVASLAALQCGHVFHSQCLEGLRMTEREKAKCPLCRVFIRGILPLYFERPTLNIDNLEEITEDDIDNVKVNNEPVFNAALVVGLDSVRRLPTSPPEQNELDEAEAEICELQSQLEIVEADRDAANARHHSEIFELGQNFDRERREMLRIQNNLSQRVARADSIKDQLERALREAQACNDRLREEAIELRNVRVAKELEGVLLEMGEAQAHEYLQQLQTKANDELLSLCLMLTLYGRRQEQEIERVREGLRKTKVELEISNRNLRRIGRKAVEMNGTPESKPKRPFVESTTSTILASPSKTLLAEGVYTEKVAIIDSSHNSIFSVSSASSRPPILIPPGKFTTTRLHSSTISDGCGGRKKIINFPTKRIE